MSRALSRSMFFVLACTSFVCDVRAAEESVQAVAETATVNNDLEGVLSIPQDKRPLAVALMSAQSEDLRKKILPDFVADEAAHLVANLVTNLTADQKVFVITTWIADLHKTPKVFSFSYDVAKILTTQEAWLHRYLISVPEFQKMTVELEPLGYYLDMTSDCPIECQPISAREFRKTETYLFMRMLSVASIIGLLNRINPSLNLTKEGSGVVLVAEPSLLNCSKAEEVDVLKCKRNLLRFWEAPANDALLDKVSELTSVEKLPLLADIYYTIYRHIVFVGCMLEEAQRIIEAEKAQKEASSALCANTPSKNDEGSVVCEVAVEHESRTALSLSFSGMANENMVITDEQWEQSTKVNIKKHRSDRKAL